MAKKCPSCDREYYILRKCNNCGHEFCDKCQDNKCIIVAFVATCPKCGSNYFEVISRDEDGINESEDSSHGDYNESSDSDSPSSDDSYSSEYPSLANSESLHTSSGTSTDSSGGLIVAFVIVAILVAAFLNQRSPITIPQSSLRADVPQPLPLSRPVTPPMESIMSATTEGTTQGEEEAPIPVVKAILESLDRAELNRFHNCLTSNNISLDEQNKRFVSIKLPLIKQEQQLYFVRSAGQPCGFYGAHYFTYWLVVKNNSTLNGAKYSVRHRGGSDTATILKSSTRGSYDIKSEYCTAVYCNVTVLKFDGEKYAATTCMESNNPRDNNKVYHSIPCN